MSTRVRLPLHASHCNTTLVSLTLVLATGSKWSGPINLPDNEADLRQFASQWRERFKAAEDIVVVGGGAVGVELSGEIRDEYPVRRVLSMRHVLAFESAVRTRRLRLYTPRITC